MNYYEELGVSSEATEEEIRKAFRNLSRMIHPDQHQDERLKLLAEVQMKRLTGIVDTLCHSDKRQLYDLSLVEAPLSAPVEMVTSLPPQKNNRWFMLGAGVLVGGLLVYALAILFQPRVAAPLESASTADSSQSSSAPPPFSISPKRTAIRTPERRSLDGENVSPLSSAPPAPSSIGHARLTAPTDSEAETVANLKLGGNSNPSANLNPGANLNPSAKQPLPETPSTIPQSSSTAPHSPTAAPSFQATHNTSAHSAGNRLAGTWLYVPKVKAPQKSGKPNEKWEYSAEFVELRVREDAGQIEGTYRSRYRIPDKPLQPEVSFRFQGSPEGKELDWEGPGGAKGKIVFEFQGEHTLLARWRAVETGNVLSLASGSALLVRRID